MKPAFLEIFESFFANAPVGVAIVDDQHRYIYINPFLALMNGRPVEDHIGRPVAEVLPQLEPVVRPLFERVLAGETLPPLDFSPPEVGSPPGSPEGSNRRWTGHFFQIDLGEGRKGLGAVIVETTQRFLAEQALRASELRYRELFEANPHPMWVFDVDTLRFLAVNDAAVAHYGYSRADFLAMTIVDIRPPEDEPKLMEFMTPKFRGMQHSGLWRHILRNGTVIDVDILSHALTFAGRPARLVLANDITSRRLVEAERARLLEQEREARQAAESASRAKDEFLITVSHELRTPLTAILGWAQTLQARAPDPPTLALACRTIERNVKMETRIIDDLLDMSRIVSGRLSLRTGPCDLAAVAVEALQSQRLAADAKQITMTTDIGPGPLHVLGDRERLLQVIWNLLSNAVKFTPKCGRVRLFVRREDGDVCLRIVDSGIGIAADFLPHVFDRFRQQDSSISRAFGGLGVGLAIVRHIVELHGGTVSVDSAGEGQGSTFTVCLPLARETAAPEVLYPVNRAAPERRLDALKTLVVEDDDDTRILIAETLKLYGAQVTAVATAHEAMAEIERHPYDALLSDIGMSGDDGLALMHRVRAWEEASGNSLPAAALTAYADERHRHLALAAGYRLYLAKPLDLTALIAAVCKLVGRP